ncbi:hypothetical protein LOZ12_004417 [Ophidiomyces ophidiicola]|uniref:Uncharacterized protein n=1 Tax=Ophidiomyces ophidiicola TaxID=1387563 RepID=A0ACB8UUT8_9EURO|nr:uncharacterized protein LOZ57_003015 [Ophidiomyces ophidiicola]KAI1911245.1 hypothetical protein LOZ64_004788 [Ophidiomyces ophidiicola]KAI1911914.1 hypothetical protein LOZ61_003614 [Ophidiomyces ophidiicola]KAI1931332.1 hypothetical protein LOZ60_000361 [Ophidiomyces ophidiicola]KAI1935721.1 hypothetical protein LOZ62_005880 [Ophidiomyces ophidiicola]KAI1947864.1 hypothetical protein LOZ57_003015 [Ophidiomyces ophidiicola]
MRIRYPFAGAFFVLLLLSAYIGLTPHSQPGDGTPKIPASLQPNDKFLHFVTFFALSIAFYWILDTSRRRVLHLTVFVCTLALGVGSEIVQSVIPNGRSFDPFDILANIVGSLGAVGLCTWYHKRMLERKRKARFGGPMNDGEREEDIELGASSSHGGALGPQETGVTASRSLEQEVDDWDENAVDNWEEEEGEAAHNTPSGTEDVSTASLAKDDVKLRSD